jgi:hypothetical protein
MRAQRERERERERERGRERERERERERDRRIQHRCIVRWCVCVLTTVAYTLYSIDVYPQYSKYQMMIDERLVVLLLLLLLLLSHRHTLITPPPCRMCTLSECPLTHFLKSPYPRKDAERTLFLGF